MIATIVIDKLGGHLQLMKPIIDRYQQGDPSFPNDALAWLEEAETVMSNLRLPEGSEMSALRGRILKAADATVSPDGGRSMIRRARNAAAAEALDRAEHVMRSRVLELEDRLRRFEEKMSEGITAAGVGGFLPERAAVWMEWLADAWRGLNECPSTRPLAIYLASSLTSQDRLVLLDRVLARLVDSGLPVALPAASGKA